MYLKLAKIIITVIIIQSHPAKLTIKNLNDTFLITLIKIKLVIVSDTLLWAIHDNNNPPKRHFYEQMLPNL